MSFSDLLNQPLPSKAGESAFEESNNTIDEKANTYLESIENELFGDEVASTYLESMEDELFGNNDYDEDTDEEIIDVADKDDDDDIDDLDIDDMSDEELAALDASLGGDELDDVADFGDDDEVELSPAEEIEADDMMSVAATAELVKDQLNAEEKAQFIENANEVAIVINEGLMTESDINEIAVEDGLVTEAKYTQKMIIRLDAESKKKQLYALAVNVSAAAHNDKDYIKLKKVMKMRKILRARLSKKYHNEATKRMKVYFKRLRNSKSTTMSNIGNRVSK